MNNKNIRMVWANRFQQMSQDDAIHYIRAELRRAAKPPIKRLLICEWPAGIAKFSAVVLVVWMSVLVTYVMQW